MTDTHALNQRSDMDILADVEDITIRYPPLNNDRDHLYVQVVNGVVYINGHVKTVNTQAYLVQSVGRLPDVTDVNTDFLYVDELVRLEVGRVVPVGLSVWVEYGTVVLSGAVPGSTNVDEMVARIGAIPGVVRVVTALRS